jgi:3-hydroxyacyl-[acyl-carrier-protein] dehydratase
MHSVNWRVAPDHPTFAGHFPGQPLLPGVVLLSEVLEAALAEPALAALVGTAPRVGAAKFLAPVRPGSELVLQLTAAERTLRFEVWGDERLVASGHFETGVAK